MNKVILIGRLAADPEMRTTPTNLAVARFAVAVDRRFAKEGGQTVDFLNCVAWKQNAEFICRYFRKGQKIAIEGSIQTRTWETNGTKRYATEIVVDHAEFVEKKQDSGYPYQGQRFPDYNIPQKPPEDGFVDLGDASEEDLPF